MCDVWNDVSGDAAIPSVSDEDRDDTTTDVRGAIANPFRVNDDVVKDISAVRALTLLIWLVAFMFGSEF